MRSRLASALSDRYTIERELGRGGMATVYLAADHRYGRRVAVKVLDPELAQALGPERFRREIEFSARLTHPNILPMYEAGDVGGLLYYVMPYIEGESLRDRLQRERHLPLEDAVAIVTSVAAALSVAHREGIVHRDIKPENILLSGDQAVVADFGIARAVDAAGAERLTATGLAIGTPAYMSPEQVGGERGLDGRSDVYSLGCVAYEMLAGEPPFRGATPQAVMARHAVDPVPPLRTLRPTLPLGVERAIERALAKVPADRFATAEAFSRALARASTVEAVAAERRSARRTRRRWAAGAAAGLSLAAVVVWRLLAPGGGAAIHRFAVLPFEDLAHDSTRQYFAEGVHEAVISDLADDGLGVIARTSVLQYRRSEKPVRQIARELGVDALVETSLARSADSVTLQTHLVDGRSQEYLWSHTYSAGVRGVPALALRVASGIAAAVDPARARAAAKRRAASRPVDPEAYDLYLKAQAHLHRPTRTDLETARQYYELAIAKDSAFALAWTGLSAYWAIGRQRGYFTPQESTAPAEAAAYKALALDSTLAEVHYTLAGNKVWGDWDWADGDREFQRAIALRPDYAEARAFYANLLCILGRPGDALRQMQRARELDPLDPMLTWIDGVTLTLLRRYDDALALYRAALARSPNDRSALWLSWVVLHSAGRYGEAFPVLRQWALATGDSTMVSTLAEAFQRAGYVAALRAGADLVATRARAPSVVHGGWNIAMWYAAAGDHAKALDGLERAYREHDPTMPYLGVHPLFIPLHNEPRFQELMRKMRLPATG